MSARNNNFNNRNGQGRRYQNNNNRYQNEDNQEVDYQNENNQQDRPRGQGRGPPRNQNQNQNRGQQQQRNNQPQRNNQNRGYRGPRQPIVRANFADDAPPVPGHLSTAHSQMQNDPLMKASIVGEPDSGLSPRADDPNIFSGCDGLTTIIDILYEKAVSAKQGFSKRVPSSCFAVYCATLTYARLLSIHAQNGYPLTSNELEFVRLVRQSGFKVPSILSVYLNGFGNTKIPDGRRLKYKLDKPDYVAGEFNGANIPGYFDRVSAETHYKYKSYPCLAVYYQRILADLLITADREAELLDDGYWDLPPNIVPVEENRNYPTENLLGYRQAHILSNVERDWVTRTIRFTNHHPGFANLPIPFSSNLLIGVSTELEQVEALKFEDMNLQVPQGSVGQLLSEQVVQTEVRAIENDKTFAGTSLCELNQIVVCLAGPLRYRVWHHIGECVQDWSIYSFNDLADVPVPWIDSINTLRDREYPELDFHRYQTQEFDPSLRVRTFVENDSNPKRLFY